MSRIRSPRDIMVEFIELYRSFPCLWQVKNRDYGDRNMKAMAFDTLEAKYKELEPQANKDMVTKKINALRTVYKKELNKVHRSRRSGGKVYKPSLWYFNLFHEFLADQDTSRSSRSSLDDENLADPRLEAGDGYRRPTGKWTYQVDTPRSPSPSPPQSPSPSPPRSPSPSYDSALESQSRPSAKKRRASYSDGNATEAKTTEVNTNIEERLNPTRPDDHFELFGKYIAERLRRIKADQNKLAQKLISDVLFEADMGSLNRYSTVSSPLEPELPKDGEDPAPLEQQLFSTRQSRPQPSDAASSKADLRNNRQSAVLVQASTPPNHTQPIAPKAEPLRSSSPGIPTPRGSASADDPANLHQCLVRNKDPRTQPISPQVDPLESSSPGIPIPKASISADYSANLHEYLVRFKDPRVD